MSLTVYRRPGPSLKSLIVSSILWRISVQLDWKVETGDIATKV